MGILRTDKISGLETPTAAVTGSVYFDGSDDFLTLPDSCGFDSSVSYTVEMWVKDVEVPSGSSPFFTFGASGATNQTFNIDYTSAGNLRLDYYSNSINFPVDLNDGNWHHIAATYDGTTRRIFADGYLGASDTTTNGAYVADNVRVGRMNWISRFAKCYISNLRVVTGTALYTSDFTVPTHALEVIDGTILLCCNNKDNAAAIDHANIGVSKSITVNGGAAVSTLSPSLTRDFTYGTEFKGVTAFDTQGYFVPPSGTTTERYPTGTGGAGAGTRGVVFGGYYPSSPNRSNVIDYITISTLGNAQDFGDRLNTTDTCAACASATRALNAGGYDGSATINTIEYVTIASTGNAVDFGDTRIARRNRDGCASSTRGLFGGGYPIDDAIDYVTIATQGTSVYFGNLTSSRYNLGGLSSPTRGVFAGGQPANGDTIDYVTIATTGDAVDFGNLTASSTNTKGASSTTRGIFGHNTNVINYITIASLGDAQDFGDLNYNPNANTCTSSLIRGVFMGGGSPTTINTISYITIASTGDAVDFGDLTQARQSLSATSSGHGGLG